MFSNCFNGKKIVFADFRDVNTPIMVNFKLPKWCQLTLKSPENLTVRSCELVQADSSTPLIYPQGLAAAVSEVYELKAFYFMHLSIYFRLFSIMFLHYFLNDKSNRDFLSGLFFFKTHSHFLKNDCNLKLRMSHISS